MIGFEIVAVAALSALVVASPSFPVIQSHSSGNGDWKSKIKNVVILVEENRSFDTFAGGLDYSRAIDGLLHHNYCNSLYVFE